MMNHLSEQNSIVWLIFIVYALTALLILPSFTGDRPPLKSAEEDNERAIGFASRFLTRMALIFPMLALLKNSI